MSQPPDLPATARSAAQIDYGSTWADPDPDSTRQWRVSWDPSTGDLTCTDVNDETDVRNLGRLPTRADVDDALSGWAAACLAGEPPAWIANRVSSWFSTSPKVDPRTITESARQEPRAASTDPARADRLPAAPIARVLADYQADFGDTDTGMFARGLGLDEEFVDDVVSGRITTLDVEQIADVCEGLWASPYDLWHPDEARTILHAYGPERWPRTILPVDEPTPVASRDSFIARRLDQQAAEVIESAIRRSHPSNPEGRHLHAVAEPDRAVTATAYSITGILAVDKEGRISEPSPRNIADPDVEYHFQFTPIGRRGSGPQQIPTGVSAEDVSAGPPPGASVHPELAAAAETLRNDVCGRADMVRFTAADGDQAWVGWDPDTQSWDAWDDPRDHFPGPGDMIIARTPPEIVAPPMPSPPRLRP